MDYKIILQLVGFFILMYLSYKEGYKIGYNNGRIDQKNNNEEIKKEKNKWGF